jgi:transposase
VRREEHRQLMKDGDGCIGKIKYSCLTSSENRSEQQAVVAATYYLQRQTVKAWAYKQLLRDLWAQSSAESETTYLNDWYKRVI